MQCSDRRSNDSEGKRFCQEGIGQFIFFFCSCFSILGFFFPLSFCDSMNI